MNTSPLVVFHTHDYCFNCNTRSIVGITENGDEISIDNEYEIEELQAYKKLLLRYIYEMKILNEEEGVL